MLTLTRPLNFVFPAIMAAGLALPPLADAAGPAPKRGQAQFEIKFMKGMIDHHTMAVEMAMLCDGRASTPELLERCGAVVTAQTAEIAEMQTWLDDWYGITHEPQMTKKMERDLAFLESFTGEAFEIAFLEMMIEHHMMAIKEGGKCVKKGVP